MAEIFEKVLVEVMKAVGKGAAKIIVAQPAAVKPSEKQEKGVTCGNCGKENKDGAKFCRYCGTPLVAKSIRFCTECGHKIRPGGKFCPACGTKVED